MARDFAARISRRVRRQLSISGVCGLALLLSSEARALPPDRCQADRDCRQLTELASSLASQGQYEEALATFQRAYERVPEPRLLVNLGRCHFRLGRPQKALGLYRALQGAMPTLPPELDAKVKQFIAEAEEALSRDPKSASSGTGTGTANGLASSPPLPEKPAEKPAEKSPEKSPEKPPEKPPEKSPEKPPESRVETGSAGPAGSPGGSTVSDVPGSSSPAAGANEGGRPTWRIALGASSLALGVGGVAMGAWALSVDGQCAADSMLFPGRCVTTTGSDGQMTAQVRNGLPAGVGFLVTGGALLVTGAVLIALPGRRPTGSAALRLPSRAEGWGHAPH